MIQESVGIKGQTLKQKLVYKEMPLLLPAEEKVEKQNKTKQKRVNKTNYGVATKCLG